MVVGQRALKVACLSFVLTLICAGHVSADTVKDLYDVYGKTYNKVCPEDVTDVISQYQRAIKYAAMYQYVEESEFDSVVLEKKKTQLTNDLQSAKEKLLSGYNMSAEDIFYWESQYSEYSQQIEEIDGALQCKDVPYNAPIADAPTYAEYLQAVKLKRNYNQFTDIGNVSDVAYPTDNGALVEDATMTHITLRTVNESVVSALFDGDVVAATDGAITVYSGCDVYTYYGDMHVLAVKQGDHVKCGDVLGKSTRHLTLKLKIDGELCDLRKIFED